ncbi:MAG: hypothetical protein IKP61_00275 [Spirochaetales bacterium]|nr:hypothetical protein [Spirochaetales bacterium]
MEDKSDSLISSFEKSIQNFEPYKEALSVIQDSEYAPQLSSSHSSALGIMEDALKQGLFDDSLRKAVSDMIAPFHEYTVIKEVQDALGNSFASLVKPDYLDAIQSLTESIPRIDEDLNSKLEMSIDVNFLIDTSWMQKESNWLAEKKLIAEINIPEISEMTDSFASLCRLEQKTSLLEGIPDSMISATSQIASIYETIKPFTTSLNNLYSSTRLLSDYCSFAVRQHELIQNAVDLAERSWRMNVLDAASKFVDRQTSWTASISKQLVVNDSNESNELYETEFEESPISLIPSYVGFTRRETIQKTPSEGLEESSIVMITEKGKKIVEGIIQINQLQLDRGAERIFGLSEKVVSSLMSLSTIICTSSDQLGKIIDGLYFVFYENLEHIKGLVGFGSSTTGDEIVRREDDYQCIFRVKTMRSDFRHDLEHGSTRDRIKKQKEVGNCYQRYCGNRPLKERDYKKLQEKLYDEILILEEKLISCQLKEKTI